MSTKSGYFCDHGLGEVTHLGKVILYNTMLPSLYLTRMFENKNSPSLTPTVRLGDKSCIFFTPTECLKVTKTKKFDNYSSMCVNEITYSAGMHHDRGNMLYSLGKSLSILFMFRANESFLHISIMPGKWLIF